MTSSSSLDRPPVAPPPVPSSTSPSAGGTDDLSLTSEDREWIDVRVGGTGNDGDGNGILNDEDDVVFKRLGKASRSPSLEILMPSHDHHTRETGLVPATFNMVATIVGGGVLSLPLAFEKCGLVLGTILMIAAAFVTDFSLYILCSCARRTGSTSYGEVAGHGFGPQLELFTTVLLFVFLLFVIVAYMVLVRGIWTPLLLALINVVYPTDTTTTTTTTTTGDGESEGHAKEDVVLLVVLVVISPFLLKRDLHALRHNCYVGFASVSVLCLALIYRCIGRNREDPTLFARRVKYFPTNFSDALFAFPLIVLSFLSSFNVIGVHGALVNPTRQRVRKVIDASLLMCFSLTYVFGVAGYLYAYDTTDGNILLNFDATDPVVILGRVGCGVTICVAMAVMTVPCRDAAVTLIEEWGRRNAYNGGAHLGDKKDGGCCGGGGRGGDGGGVQEPLAVIEGMASPPRGDVGRSSGGGWRSAPVVVGEQQPLLSLGGENNGPPGGMDADTSSRSLLGDMFSIVSVDWRERVRHAALTLAIIGGCYVGATSAPGVAIVWSICGSSMAFIIAFILPAACYIKLRRHKGHFQYRLFLAWVLLIASCIAAVACTCQTVWIMAHGGNV